MRCIPLFSVLLASANAAKPVTNLAGNDIFVTETGNGNGVRRSLQSSDDDSLPLYESLLVISATTPYASSYSRCIGWPNHTSPTNWTWFGFQIQLPDGVSVWEGQRYSDITSATKEDGLVQRYNQTSPPLVAANYTIQYSDATPTIKMKSNDDLFWVAYMFSFDSDSLNDEGYEEKTKTYNVMCTIDEDVAAGSWTGTTGVIPTLTISMNQRLIREGIATTSSGYAPASGGRLVGILSALFVAMSALVI